MTTVSFTAANRAGALVFSSNWEGVTFRREKTDPHFADRARRDPGCGDPHFDRREHVCAVARHTSKDSARAQSADRHDAACAPGQRDSLGRIETQRHYDSPDPA